MSGRQAGLLTALVPGLLVLGAVVTLGVLGTALAFVILYVLIGVVGARRAQLVSYLAPGFALVYGAALLGEPITSRRSWGWR